MRVLIKGAGDLATGVAQALHRAGMEILMTEISQPLAVRRGASLAQAVFDGSYMVEDIKGRLAADLPAAARIIREGAIPILVDEQLDCLAQFAPQVLIEATLAKKNHGLKPEFAPLVIALGPGFTAGVDAHVVIETMRGNGLARLIYDGQALPDTGEPGLVAGVGVERLLRANAAGLFRHELEIGEVVQAGQTVAFCGETPLTASIGGCVRGLLQQGLIVKPGMKVGDIDPRHEPELCFSVSDKARALGGAALVAIMADKVHHNSNLL